MTRVRESRSAISPDPLVQDEISPAERQALIKTVRESYMEIFPTATIESKLDVLEPGSYVAVTCSPTKGVDETLDMAERLADRGFRVVPHIAARMVRDKSHLRKIVRRLDATPIVSLFVPGGDADPPTGVYSKALQLLRDLADIEHKISEIGIAAHPEGHPAVADAVLLQELLKKQQFATYLVTQMCFDASRIGSWLRDIRAQGADIETWLGLPGACDRSALLKTSLRIGVGDSVRFLKRHGKKAAEMMASKRYTPNKLLVELAPFIADPTLRIAGHHLFCFNQVEQTEAWRRGFTQRQA